MRGLRWSVAYLLIAILFIISDAHRHDWLWVGAWCWMGGMWSMLLVRDVADWWDGSHRHSTHHSTTTSSPTTTLTPERPLIKE